MERHDEYIEIWAEGDETTAIKVAQRAQIIAQNARRTVRVHWQDRMADVLPTDGARTIARRLEAATPGVTPPERETVTMEPRLGKRIDHVIRDATYKAAMEDVNVQFTFNDVTMEVSPATTVEAGMTTYNRLCAERAEAHAAKTFHRADGWSAIEQLAQLVSPSMQPKRSLPMGTIEVRDVNGDFQEAQAFGSWDRVSGRIVVHRIELPVGRMFDGRELGVEDLSPRLAEPLTGRAHLTPLQVTLDETEKQAWEPAVDSLWVSNSRSDGLQYRVLSVNGEVVRLEPQDGWTAAGVGHGVPLEGFRDAFTAVVHDEANEVKR